MCVERSDTGVSLLLNCITPNVWVVKNEVKPQRHFLHIGFPVLPYHNLLSLNMETCILMFIHNTVQSFFSKSFLLMIERMLLYTKLPTNEEHYKNM